jgi:Tfp pilus assembly protein PilF
MQTGEYAWATDLLQQSLRNLPPDPDFLLDLATCEFSVGQVSNAASNIQKALDLSGAFERRPEAQRFQTLIGIVLRPETAPSAATAIQDSLAANPKYAPAQAAAAYLEEQRGNYVEARTRWESLLQTFPLSPATAISLFTLKGSVTDACLSMRHESA